MTTREAAEILGVSARTIAYWLRKGLHADRVTGTKQGRRWVVALADPTGRQPKLDAPPSRQPAAPQPAPKVPQEEDAYDLTVEWVKAGPGKPRHVIDDRTGQHKLFAEALRVAGNCRASKIHEPLRAAYLSPKRGRDRFVGRACVSEFGSVVSSPRYMHQSSVDASRSWRASGNSR